MSKEPTPYLTLRGDRLYCLGSARLSPLDNTYFRRFRRWRLLEEIFRVDTYPDILTVQECDHFKDFFEPCMNAMGYSGIFAAKRMSPCLRFGYYSDGVAIFWKRSLFEHLRNVIAPSEELAHVAFIGVILRHLPSGKSVCATTCHLKAKRGEKNESLRMLQIQRIFGILESSAFEHGIPILLMGDFNTTPSEHSVSDNKACTAVIDYVCLWKDRYLETAYPFTGPIIENFGQHDLSSWNYSTWKTRGGVEVKQLIDYIWFSRRHFELKWILSAPLLGDFNSSRSKLPDLRYPSDHCSLCAKFMLR